MRNWLRRLRYRFCRELLIEDEAELKTCRVTLEDVRETLTRVRTERDSWRAAGKALREQRDTARHTLEAANRHIADLRRLATEFNHAEVTDGDDSNKNAPALAHVDATMAVSYTCSCGETIRARSRYALYRKARTARWWFGDDKRWHCNGCMP